MNKLKVYCASTRDEAREYAIEWQQWLSEQSLSYGELAEWYEIFKKLGYKYGLSDEFKKNGVI